MTEKGLQPKTLEQIRESRGLPARRKGTATKIAKGVGDAVFSIAKIPIDLLKYLGKQSAEYNKAQGTKQSRGRTPEELRAGIARAKAKRRTSGIRRRRY